VSRRLSERPFPLKRCPINILQPSQPMRLRSKRTSVIHCRRPSVASSSSTTPPALAMRGIRLGRRPVRWRRACFGRSNGRPQPEGGERPRSCLGRELLRAPAKPVRASWTGSRLPRRQWPLCDEGRNRTLTGSAACRAVKSGAPFSARATIALRRGKETAGCRIGPVRCSLDSQADVRVR
jgi:hypothetical protein